METPLFITTYHVPEIIATMKAEGIHDQFMAQLKRIEDDPARPYNAIVMGEFHDGQGTARFISYHFHPDDAGWRMITLKNCEPEVIALVRADLEAGFVSPVKPLFVDAAGMRN
jgi:hypothetical protein